MRFRLLTAFLLAVGLVPAVPARTGELARSDEDRGGRRERVAELESGAAAPAGRWYVSGGCASRSGVSRTEPVRSAPREAWTYDARGEIESEPLVWDDLVVIAVRDSLQRRSLHLLDLNTGRKLRQQLVPSTVPLEPAMWANRIAVRPAPDRVDVFRIAVGNRLQPLRTIKAETGSISAPLIYEGELYLRNGRELQRYDLDRREPVWRAVPKGGFRGRPSLRGEHVYGVWYDERNFAHLSSLSRATGEAAGEVLVGHHGGAAPAEDAPLDVIVHESNVFVHFPLPVESTKGGGFNYGRAERRGAGFAERDGTALHLLATEPVALQSGWVALMERDGARSWVVPELLGMEGRSVVLASAQHHAELLESAHPASVSAGVLLLNGLAVETTEFEVLWRSSHEARFRPVPAEETVLVVAGKSRLVALRPAPRTQGRAAAAALQAVSDLEAQLADGYAALAQKSLRTNDPDLTRRLIAEAMSLDAGGRALEAAQDGLGRLVNQERRPQPDPRKIRAIEDEERALLDEPRKKLLELAGSTRDPAWQRALLQALLERYPNDVTAARSVRALVPDDAPQGTSFDPESWLDFLDVHERTPVRFVQLPARGSGRSAEQRTLAEETEEWRPDLSGYRSEGLFIVTPPDRPGAVARSLAVGELVCDALEEIFAPLGRSRGTQREPLTLFMYETQEEYMRQSQRESSMPEIAHGWTAGHYSASEKLSRMFVPSDGARSMRLLGVYAHELTHHWLDTRAPFSGVAGGGDATPGYWIAEGFATLIEEFRFDLESGAWDPINPRAESLDTLANASAAQLLDWERLFDLSHQGFQQLSTTPDRQIPLSWKLGVRQQRSVAHMYYAQAGAVCHYLFNAEGGKRREELLRFVEAWYRGDKKGLDAATAFGMDPNELGGLVVAFARETVRGN